MARGYRRPTLSAGAYLGKEAAPYVAPWLLSLGAMPVAVVIHLTIGNDGSWMLILGGLFTLMTFGTWWTWKARRAETRITVTVLVGAALAWIGLAGAATPWSGDLLKAWVIGGFAGSLFWTIRHAGVVAGHDRDRVESGSGSWLGDKISAFKGAKVDKRAVKETADELRIPTTLEAPTTSSDAQRSREQIASVAGVGKDQVKVLKDASNEAKATVVFTRRTDTAKPVGYRGPSAPGQSCAAAPLYLGRRTDGSEITWWMPGSSDPASPRPVAHSKTTGVTGSGKTETICTAVLDMRWRTDIVPVIGDPAKFQQSFGDIAECLGLKATTKQQVMQLFDNLAREVVTYRAELLGSLERSDGGIGYKQWEPECYTRHGVPFLFVDIEEAADVVMDRDEEVDEAVRKLRSLGIKLNLSMQTMPHDNIPRKTRGQFSESLAHGQNEYQDAKYALSEHSLEAGADPTKWKNDSPGSLYAEVTGTDKNHWPVDGRAVYMTPAQKAMSIEGSRQYWAEIDPGTYERLALGIDPAFPLPSEDDEDEDLYTDEELEQEEQIMESPFAGVAGADPNEPLTPPRPGLNVQFSDAPKAPTMDTATARQHLQNRIDVLENSGQSEITFDDLADLPELVGRTPGWVYNNLSLLVDAGRLTMYRPPRGKAVYRILPRRATA